MDQEQEREAMQQEDKRAQEQVADAQRRLEKLQVAEVWMTVVGIVLLVYLVVLLRTIYERANPPCMCACDLD